MKKYLYCIFLLSGCLCLLSCSDTTFIKRHRPLMGTMVEITVPACERAEGNDVITAIEAAFSEIARCEALMSVFIPQSDVAQINDKGPTQWVEVSDEVFALLKQARVFNEQTGGAFDVTVGMLLAEWGFYEQERGQPFLEKEPTSGTGDKRGELLFDDTTTAVRFSRPDMAIDLGGIAKGYAVDQAVAVLKKHGIRHALVNAGGDIYALGRRSTHGKWQIGIQHPRKARALFGRCAVEDRALVSSGDYEQFYEKDGRRFTHIMDPASRRPVQSGSIHVSVAAASCAQADALATAFFVMGPEKTADYCADHPGIDVLMITEADQGYRVFMTQGFDEAISLIENMPQERL